MSAAEQALWLIDAGAYVSALCPIGGGRFAAALGDGSLYFLDPGTREGKARPNIHHGAILSAVTGPDGASVLTGGDDGRLVLTAPGAEPGVLAEEKGRWIEHVAASQASGAHACTVGKEVLLFRKGVQGVARRLSHPTTVGGLALDGKGRRLAATHYGGVSLWWTQAQEGEATRLYWGGSHLLVRFDPDTRFVVTAMQENSLHGWRIADQADMRMAGYPAKTKAMDFTHDGKHLATAGAAAIVLWPFQGKDGPMGKKPVVLAESGELVTAIACHPKRDLIAAGHVNGMVLMARMRDGGEAVLDPGDGSPVTALAWQGDRLAFGTEAGRIGILSPPA